MVKVEIARKKESKKVRIKPANLNTIGNFELLNLNL